MILCQHPALQSSFNCSTELQAYLLTHTAKPVMLAVIVNIRSENQVNTLVSEMMMITHSHE